MKVILNQDVVNLGEEGDVKEVARGYARNFLIPQSMALPYNKATIVLFEQRKNAIEKRKDEKRKQSQGLKDRIEGEDLLLVMPAGDTGKLFGSVNNANIADELAKHGIQVERKKIEIPEHSIKAVGNYTIRIRLYDNQQASLKVRVQSPEQVAARKKEEAKQAAAEKDAESAAAKQAVPEDELEGEAAQE